HGKRPKYVFVAYITSAVLFELRIGDQVDINAKNHLRYLATSDGYIYPFGYVKSQSPKSIV
ncbi:hypothetical protein BpHYR1_034984, partial [Brachionus plicatilis]